MQKTIEKKVVIVGTGIHSGRPVRVNINPAPTNHGIVFKRLDVDQNNPLIEANFKNILSGELCTSLVNKNGISVKTVEHLLYSSEYKRRQAAPGVKISERNFGYDRRYPITNSFRDMDN